MVSPDEEAIVRCETTTGPVTMKLHREWAPNGYDRAVELFERRFFDDSHIFRAIPNFLVQFGISYSEDKELQKFARSQIQDDPPRGMKFHKGTMSFAGSGPNSRTSQMFISYGSAESLGKELWETPFGEVIEGMENAEKFYSYGDMPPWGKGPVQGKIHGHPEYIEENFPKIDKFVHCKVERLNVEEEKEIIYKEDMVTDEEAFAQAQELLKQDRELLQVEGKGVYKPHVLDQMGLPGMSDPIQKYGGFAILTIMGIAMLLVNGRKKVEGKSN